MFIENVRADPYAEYVAGPRTSRGFPGQKQQSRSSLHVLYSIHTRVRTTHTSDGHQNRGGGRDP